MSFLITTFSSKPPREKEAARLNILSLAESGLVQLFVSREVLTELKDVLNRPEIRAHLLALSDEIVGAFLKRLQKLSTLLRPGPKKFSHARAKTNLTST